MAGNSGTMIKLAAGAAVAYYAYKQGWLSMLGIAAPAAAAPTSAAPVQVAPDPNAITGANTVSGIQAATLLAAGAPAAGLSVDQWGYALNNVLAPLGKAAPDPMPLFTAAAPGFSRGQLVTAGQYWAVMGPALKSQLGLSGLGMYGGF
jgi:uncharacterized protein (DUF1501 family)